MTDRPLRILIVEDHEDTRKYLRLYLEQSGHTVLSASTIKQAVECLVSSPCDVVLSDIGLRDGSGWELLNEPDLPRPIYAIAMSGFGTNADAHRSKAAGYRSHLVKPIDPDLLDQLLLEARRERDGV
jgi:two-component system CheB/CheR fusion protein